VNLTEFLQKNKENGPARFYMPGHKGHFPLDSTFDITEITGADSLYDAAGPIRETEKRFERLYGSRATVLSAGGTTLCIQGMLAAAQRKYGIRRILAARNAHVTFLNACALLGIDPEWVRPTPYDDFGVSGAVTPAQLEAALKKHPDVDAVYITSPDYFGMCSDIAGLAAVCKAHGLPLLVDNAHGAHLKFLPEDLHPLKQGAALCCDGAHKTLPVLTGGALLHAGDDFTASELKRAMALFSSTSPSYLIMQSLDACASYLETDGRAEFAALVKRLDSLRKLAKERGLFVFDSEPARLSVAGAPKGYDGDLAAFFREHGVECDYSAGGAAVLMPTPFNTEAEFSALRTALEAFAPDEGYLFSPPSLPPLPKKVMTPREAVLAPCVECPVEKLTGKVAAETKILCPPGVAIVAAGEEIDENGQKLLKSTGIFSLKVL